ncbi:MAG: hypothetical protein JWS10_2973 [Cypionkella sp.]|uniref:hypothetical protein n=1 Tax=Cypionkella sp. TaxID=2811411 RepID=UPI00260F15CC|nr:hypothetical protein [Cypionkella sp.]MDB5660358.1 hypothetical protein [Cypionkella sp.]
MTNGKTATSSVVNLESEMALARIAAGLDRPNLRKYHLPLDEEAFVADMKAAEAAGKLHEIPIGELVYLPNGKSLKDSTDAEIHTFFMFELFLALGKDIEADWERQDAEVAA